VVGWIKGRTILEEEEILEIAREGRRRDEEVGD
jgi:hypothetical protein